MTAGERDPRRALPSVDHLLREEAVREWVDRWGRSPVASAIRQTLREARERLSAGTLDTPPGEERLLATVGERLRESGRPAFRAVINGTGVILHTNLGRAPLPPAAVEAVRRTAPGYSNLEYDLRRGERGSRHVHCAELLRELTRAEAALVVNNNAAAVSLVVNEFARGRPVVVSRGELVEIGGSFRIPEMVERSGARLRAVGTTNRTRLSDYREALNEGAGLLLKVHPSNYRVEGFTASVGLRELVGLARRSSVPLLHDLGSGLLRPELLEGFPPEPSPGTSLRAGVDLVTWSGDKLLGGPQAGVILGTASALDRLRTNPLLRAVRVDKTTLAALEATLRLYRSSRAAAEVPALRMLREAASEVERRAREARGALEASVADRVRVREMEARVGGGAFPGHAIGSAGWEVSGDPERLERCCRGSDPPLIGRIEDGGFLIDFRTVLPGEEELVARAVTAALRGGA